MTKTSIKVGKNWRPIDKIYIKVQGSWILANRVCKKLGDSWEEIWSIRTHVRTTDGDTITDSSGVPVVYIDSKLLKRHNGSYITTVNKGLRIKLNG